jgi:hypothetical protein
MNPLARSLEAPNDSQSDPLHEVAKLAFLSISSGKSSGLAPLAGKLQSLGSGTFFGHGDSPFSITQ